MRRDSPGYGRGGRATRGGAVLRQGGGVGRLDQRRGEWRPDGALSRRDGRFRSAADCGGRPSVVPGEGPRGQLCDRGGIAVPRLSVIALSQASHAFWDDLAGDVGAAIDAVGPAAAVTSWPATAAVIVAAGGAAPDATPMLEVLP